MPSVHPVARRHAERRALTRDDSVPACGHEKSTRIDLGLAILSCHAVPGVRYSRDEIAAFAGCTDSAIGLIEERALRKIRARADPSLLRDLHTHLRHTPRQIS